MDAEFDRDLGLDSAGPQPLSLLQCHLHSDTEANK